MLVQIEVYRHILRMVLRQLMYAPQHKPNKPTYLLACLLTYLLHTITIGIVSDNPMYTV